jgi:ribosomal protein L3
MARPDTKVIHSHSIINEPSKLLISKCLQVARSIFTVIFTVKVSGTSIGAGFRAIRRKVTFRDLSTSIGSGERRGHHRRASVSVRAAPKKRWHRTS